MTADGPRRAIENDLRLFGYRMSGSLAWADEFATTTLLTTGEAASAADGEERETLYDIALERCLLELNDRPPRGLPAWIGSPAAPIAPDGEPPPRPGAAGGPLHRRRRPARLPAHRPGT